MSPYAGRPGMGRSDAPEKWREDGACFGRPDLVDAFHPPGEPTSNTEHVSPDVAALEAEALTYCNRCPVRDACLEFALSTRQEYGIWGGMTARDRRKVRRQRQRATQARSRAS